MGATCCGRATNYESAIGKRRKDNEKQKLLSKEDTNTTVDYGTDVINKQPINVEKKEESKGEQEKNEQEKEEKKQENKAEKKEDPKIQLSLECELGTLLQSLPMEGTIEYEKENTFWLIQLGKEWQDSRQQFAELTDKLFVNEEWYKKGIERGTNWAKLLKEDNIDIKTVPPTAISGLHITLARVDINSVDKPQCFVENGTVKFKIKRLVCHPPFRSNPKNMPGQQIDDKGYRYYATHWMSLEIEFLDFDYKTKFPAHISLCNIAVKLKADAVDSL